MSLLEKLISRLDADHAAHQAGAYTIDSAVLDPEVITTRATLSSITESAMSKSL